MVATLELLIKGEDKASGVLKDVGDSSEGLGHKLGALIAVAGGVVAGFASFKTLESAVSSTQELGEAVRKMTVETGLSSEASSRLLFDFKHFGIGADDASRALGIFAKHLKGVQDAEDGSTASADAGQAKIDEYRRKIDELNTSLTTKKTPEQIQKITDEIANLNEKITIAAEAPSAKGFAKILADIGINSTDAAGNMRGVADLLPEVTDHFKLLSERSDKAAAATEASGLAMQLFGKQGRELLPFLEEGSAGIEALGKEADKLGLTLSGENVAKIHDFTLAHRDMDEAIGGLKLTIGLALMPVLTSLAQFFINAQPTIREFIGNGIEKLKGAIDDISKNDTFLAFLSGVRDGLRDVRDFAVDLKDKLPEALKAIGDAASNIPGFDKLTALLGATKEAGQDKDQVEGLGSAFAKGAVGLLAFSVAAGTLDTSMSIISNSVSALGGTISTVALLPNPLLLIVAAIAAVAIGLVILEEKTHFLSENVLPALKDIADWVQTKVVPAVEKFAKTELFPRLQKFGVWLKSDFIPTVRRVAEDFRRDWLPTILQVAKAIGEFLLPVFDNLYDIWRGAIVPFLEGAVIPALKFLGEWIGKITVWFSEHKTVTLILVGTLIALAAAFFLLGSPILATIAILTVVIARWDDIQKLFTVTIPQAIDSLIAKVEGIPIIGAIFKDTLNGIETLVTAWSQLIPVLFTFAVQSITNYFDFWKAIFTGDWGGAWDAIKNEAEAIWNALAGIFGIALDAIKALADSKLEMLASIGSTIGNAIAGGITGGFEMAKSAIVDAINWIIDRINEFAGGINDVLGPLNQLSSLVGGPDIPTIPTIPEIGGPTGVGGGSYGGAIGAYQFGGLVPGLIGQPQLAVVHGGERVLTPGQQRGGWGIGNVEINIYGAEGQSPQELGRAVREQIEELHRRGL